MNLTLSQINIHIVGWMLVMVRVGTFFYTAPFFGSSAINKILKGYLIAIISYVLYKMPGVTPITDIPNVWILSFIILKEFTIGMVMTFAANIIYLPMRIIGIQIGRSAGLGRAQVFNPEEKNQFTVVQQFVYIIGILIFLIINGHHLVLKVLVLTFKHIPIGQIHLNPMILTTTSSFFSHAFAQGMVIAAPIMGCILINSFCFGILGKAIPQMNLLVVDLPVRVFVAILGLSFAFPMIATIYRKFIGHSMFNLEKLVYIMSGGNS